MKAKKTATRNRINPGLVIVKKVTENPRRKGSLGEKSLGIVLSSRRPMKVETFVEKGGRLRDLHYDLKQGHVALRKAA